MHFRKSHHDTYGTLAATVDTENLGNIFWAGVGSAVPSFDISALIQVLQDGTAGTTRVPTKMLFKTSPGGTTAPTTRLTIKPDGIIEVFNKIAFTQIDHDEYIDSLADGYMDYGATVAHRFNANMTISKDGDGNSLTIGQTAGNQFASIDLIGDATYTAYGLQLIRSNTGANAISRLTHRGTGDLQFHTNEAAAINFFTTNVSRMTIAAGGVITVNDKIAFTQADGNEYIDSLNDGYMDYGATTSHRFNNQIDILTDKKLQFRDAAIGIYSQADTFLDLFADGAVRIGDSSAGAPTNYLEILSSGDAAIHN